MVDLAAIKAAAAQQPGRGLVSDETLAKEIVQLALKGIPAVTTPPVYNRGPRLFPRSSNVNGHTLTASPVDIPFEGPFGLVTAMVVDNKDATYDALIMGPGITALNACRIRAAKARRLEFDTPTDSQGNPLTSLTIRAWATGTQTAPTYIEVE